MLGKRSGQPSKQKLINDLHYAIQAFIEGNGGELLVVGPLQIVAHNTTTFDLVIECVGRRPTWKN